MSNGVSEANDSWVLAALGVDPKAYEAAGKAAGKIVEQVGRDMARQKVTDGYATAKPNLDRAQNRAVLPAGDAADAQRRLAVEMPAFTAAFQARDWARAQTSLDAAIKDANTILAAPDPATVAPKEGKHDDQVLYGKEAGDKTDVSETDIHQDGLGDCYLLSSIGEIARIKPDLIKQMIKDNGNGTYTVTLHQPKTGIGYLIGKITGEEFEDVKVTVDANIGTNAVDSGGGQAEAGGKKEIWVQVLEKAYAKLHGGYDKIDHGGWAAPAMETLTGKKAKGKPASSVTVADLEDAVKTGKPMVMDTAAPVPGAPNPYKLVGPHAYMLESIRTDKSGAKFVTLRNPWGFQNPPEIPIAQIASVIQTIEEGSQL